MTSYKASAHTYLFTRTFESLSSGIYQYKFRLGEGDWWVLDEQSTVGEWDIPTDRPSARAKEKGEQLMLTLLTLQSKSQMVKET